jgi:hypothetical protein
LAAGILGWSVGVILRTSDVDVCSEAIAVVIALLDSSVPIDYAPLNDVITYFFVYALPCQEGSSAYIESLYAVFAFMLKVLIPKADVRELIPGLFELARDTNCEVRDFALQILGQFVESAKMEPEFVFSLLDLALDAIRSSRSPFAAFVVNQCASGSPEVLAQIQEVVVSLLLHVISINQPGDLTEACVCALGAILPRCESCTINQHLLALLRAMPAREHSTNHSEMMSFFLWLASRTNCEPKEQFLSVLIRFFSIPDWRIVLSKRNPDLVASLKSLAIELATSFLDFPTLCADICFHDAVKLACIQSTLSVSFSL